MIVQETAGEIVDTFPASFDGQRWFVVSPADSTLLTGMVDLENRKVETPLARKTAPSSLIEKSMDRPSVTAFLDNAIVPFAELQPVGQELWWRDLSYDFSPEIQLHVLKIRYDDEMEPVSDEFRERW